MRYLDRAGVPAPDCLSRFDHTGDTWATVTRADKEEIRRQLGILQNNNCAYCECDIRKESSTPHIEHFEQRSRVPGKTFRWDNLFWSCSHKECCGKHKDRVVRTYKQPGVVLKPDHDHPRHYLYFGSNGEVGPRKGLNASDEHRARETIRVFALDDGRLVEMRKAYCAGPRGILEEALQAGLTPEEMAEYLQENLSFYANQPFSSAALDTLGIEP